MKSVYVLDGPTGGHRGVRLLAAATGPTGTFEQWNRLDGPTGPTGTFEGVWDATGLTGDFKTVVMDGGTPPVTASTWNPADMSAGLVLSNADLTVTGGGIANYNIRGTKSHTTGKYYAEFPDVLFANNGSVGIADASFNMLDTSQAHSFAVLNWGGISNSGGNMLDAVSGKVLCVAIDLDAHLGWFRYGAGNWNASGTANPATGVGGIDISAMLTGACFLFTYIQLNGHVTINPVAPFLQTAPAGFTPWG